MSRHRISRVAISLEGSYDYPYDEEAHLFWLQKYEEFSIVCIIDYRSSAASLQEYYMKQFRH